MGLHGFGLGYCFGFNGKERDNETYGEGNAYDFEARLLDTRLGRWLSVDPKTGKYPHETPFAFVSNNPLVCMDPDGEEKIVITGGADMHNKNRMNFVMASKVQLKNYINEVKQAKSSEKVSWMIFDLDYTPDEKKLFDAYAKANGISAPVYVKSADEVKKYLNSQNTKSQNLTEERKKDLISDVSAFSHGTPSNIAFGYDNNGPNNNYWNDPTNLNISNISDINKSAFASGCQIDLFSCNSATPAQNLKQDFPTRDEMVNSTLTLPNLVTELSKVTGQTVTGLIGRSNYFPTASGGLPTPGKTGGDYSPTVKGKSIKSIKVKAKNGKTKAN